jgi:hypothetical protein
MLENVKMKKEWQDVISDKLGLKPVLINSALVSAQNRQRLYWMNWNVEKSPIRLMLIISREVILEVTSRMDVDNWCFQGQ